MDALRELVLPRLERVRPSGGAFMATCPAHDDGKASLSVSTGKAHPVVFHCHAGCQPDDILAKLGLTWEELSTPRAQPVETGEWTPAGPASAVYDYVDEEGTLLFQVLRTVSKDFRQRVPAPAEKSGWLWKLGDTRRVLYQLPDVIRAVKEGREVWITEGEKDVHTLTGQGLVATCNPGGAGKWRVEFAEFLSEAVVVICADRDEPGQAHARAVRDSLVPMAAHVRVVEAAEGKDVTDHLNAGLTLADLNETWNSDNPSGVVLAPDFWEFIAINDEEYDWIVPGLLERGDRLMLTGFEGLGKSMLVRQLAVMIGSGLDPFHPLTRPAYEPRKVLIIDCENSPRQGRRKMRQLAEASVKSGYRLQAGMVRIMHRPEGIDLTTEQDAAWLGERVHAHKPDILFIGPFYRLHAANINDELPARRVISVLDMIRKVGDLALVIEAHSGHGDTGNGRAVRPVGSSIQMRWPEFGIGIVPAGDPDDDGRTRTVQVKHWRGGRDEREWPEYLKWGPRGGWPWEWTTEP